jgi:hypothetical protein
VAGPSTRAKGQIVIPPKNLDNLDSFVYHFCRYDMCMK